MKFKGVVDILNREKILCKKLEEIELNTRQKVRAFFGVNLKSEYCYIILWEKKAKFLKKDIEILKSFVKKDINFRYKKRILILNSICKKAKEELKDWRVITI